MSTSYCARKPVRGFTLIELVVVIAIILLLLSLVLAVGLSARSQAESREMQNILLLVDTAIKEWELISERKLSWGENDIPPDIFYDLLGYTSIVDDDINPMEQLDLALKRIRRVDSVGNILANIDSDFLQVDNGSNPPGLHLVDPWGKAVSLIHPGRITNPNLPFDDDPLDADSDGTIRTANEKIYGLTVNRTLLLVSSGPDGEFGDLTLDPNTPVYKQAADNIYSYRPEPIE
ncbi:MAG: prepilin-type N-terminal cleavage/methylation domain-containing protein [Planctomycetes bacterium]|nr:prepilin-type N-terminal cleavage/methylation domain-containing protein [Planctomycetota bacterium]